MSADGWLAKSYSTHLKSLGLLLMAVSLLYFVAANWWHIPSAFQLALPLVVFTCTALVSVYFQLSDVMRQTLQGIAGLMVGLSLAVIGQVYQTGADSYQLFLLWSILLVPWLLLPNAIIFALLIITTQLTLGLWFDQTFLLQQYPSALSLSLNLSILVFLYYSLRFYPQFKLWLVLCLGIISIASMLSFSFLQTESVGLALVSLVFPILAGYWFYRGQQTLAVSILAACTGISVLILIFDQLLSEIATETVLFLAVALISLLLFGGMGYAMFRFLPQQKFVQIPLAVGAWISGLALYGLVISLFVDQWPAVLLIGFISLVITFVLLQRQQGIFKRQFSYCILVLGQASMYWAAISAIDHVLVLVILQSLMIALLWYCRSHWVVLSLQLFLGYGIVLMCILDVFEDANILLISSLWHYFIWLALLFLTIESEKIQRSFMLLGLLSLIGANFLPNLVNQQLAQGWAIGLASMYLLAVMFKLSSGWSMQMKSAVIIFAALLISLQHIEIGLALLIGAWAIQQRDRWVYVMSGVCLSLLLIDLYYDLGSTLLQKSTVIFCSGLALGLLGTAVQYTKEQR